ncbi:MAG: hypothetical protein SF028_04165 [Candidatus Sumerlaeia bacterium]|nr:hypothetical protein [Candidatus Sumerlaeia bacterium]
MNVFPFDRHQWLRPGWAAVDAVEELRPAPGSAAIPLRSDAPQYILVVEGTALLRRGGGQDHIGAGQMALLPAGEDASLAADSAPARVLRLSERPLPPFRPAPLDAAAPAPAAPVPPRAGLRGVVVAMELDATFEPVALTDHPGQDVLLRANPGALSQGQLKEYRRLMAQGGKATLALSLDFDLSELRLFFSDRMMRSNTEYLRPRALSMPADPSTAEGRERLSLLFKEWGPAAHADGYRICGELRMRAFSEDELLGMFRFLAQAPPARAGVLLRWDAAAPKPGFESRQLIEALLPWLHAVELLSDAGADDAARFLDGLGFQGWLVRHS